MKKEEKKQSTADETSEIRGHSKNRKNESGCSNTLSIKVLVLAGLPCEEEDVSSFILRNTRLRCWRHVSLQIFCRCDLIVCVNSNCWCNEVTLRWRNPCKQIQPRRCVWRSVFDELVQAKAASPSLLKQLKRLRQQHQTLVSQYAALIIALFCLFKARDLYRAAQNILLYK